MDKIIQCALCGNRLVAGEAHETELIPRGPGWSFEGAVMPRCVCPDRWSCDHRVPMLKRSRYSCSRNRRPLENRPPLIREPRKTEPRCASCKEFFDPPKECILPCEGFRGRCLPCHMELDHGTIVCRSTIHFVGTPFPPPSGDEEFGSLSMGRRLIEETRAP